MLTIITTLLASQMQEEIPQEVWVLCAILDAVNLIIGYVLGMMVKL